jgi:predicted nucleic acid-binding Zn ribbon protein
MSAASDPQPLSKSLSELIALKGLVRVRGERQLASVWKDVAGSAIADATLILGIKRGVLQIGVTNAPLLSELACFHKNSLLRTLKEQHSELKIRDLRFLLRGSMAGS